MNDIQLGEFEELVMLTVCGLTDEAYGAKVQRSLEEHAGRIVTLSAVHSALKRLEDKGLLSSRMGGATSERGGRRKRLYTPTAAGARALRNRRSQRAALWSLIPDLNPGGSST